MPGKLPVVGDIIHLLERLKYTPFDDSVLSETVDGPRERIDVSIVLDALNFSRRQKGIVFVGRYIHVDVSFQDRPFLLYLCIDPMVRVIRIKVDEKSTFCT